LIPFHQPTEVSLLDYTELRTVRQLAAEAVFLTEGKIRWLIFHAETNGLKPALIKVGGRVYIDRREFSKWLESRRMAPASVH
jgi:hypothetical protein